MASILVLGSFLAASLLSLLLPIGLLIAVLLWHTRAVIRLPDDPSQAAVHAAVPADIEGDTNSGEAGPPSTQT